MANFRTASSLFGLLFSAATLAGCGADETPGHPPIDVDLDDPGPDGLQLRTG